ncbi:MAG: OsmC family protein [Ardenticatenaceae bacterium]|nr:OsmC family protein [Ardenticatenaceae bacterium]HBY95068.1 OsmC family peroxiredoxin [Chloroflexota bacterium]
MAELKRHATGTWRGDLRTGTGTASTGSGAIQNVTITFPSRFENAAGSNPEELVAAAHASCFSMQLSGLLSGAGTPPEEIRTTATLTLDMGRDAPTITKIHLDTEGRVPDVDDATFKDKAEEAKNICPISRLLQPGLEEMTVNARLVT